MTCVVQSEDIMPGLRLTAEVASVEHAVAFVATTSVQTDTDTTQRCFRRRVGAYVNGNRYRHDHTLRFYIDHPLLMHIIASERISVADVATTGHVFCMYDADNVVARVSMTPADVGGIVLVSGRIRPDRLLATCVRHIQMAISEYLQTV